MFVYETKKTVGGAAVEALAIKFGGTQIPAEAGAEDVIIYKDGSDVIHAVIGGKDYPSEDRE